MAKEFCHCCYKIAECRVLRGKRTHVQFPYVNAYRRLRKCESCRGKFVTYEIGEATFQILRNLALASKNLAEIVDALSFTKDEFDSNQIQKKAQKHRKRARKN